MCLSVLKVLVHGLIEPGPERTGDASQICPPDLRVASSTVLGVRTRIQLNSPGSPALFGLDEAEAPGSPELFGMDAPEAPASPALFGLDEAEAPGSPDLFGASEVYRILHISVYVE